MHWTCLELLSWSARYVRMLNELLAWQHRCEVHRLLATLATILLLVLSSLTTKVLMRTLTVGRATAVKMNCRREGLHVSVLNITPLVEKCVSTPCLIRWHLARTHMSTLAHSKRNEVTLGLSLKPVESSATKHTLISSSHVWVSANWNSIEHVTIIDIDWSLLLILETLTHLWLLMMHLSRSKHSHIKWIYFASWKSANIWNFTLDLFFSIGLRITNLFSNFFR